jgi:DNA polymerase-3 subunit delta'
MVQLLFCREVNRPCGSCSKCRQVAEQRHPDVAWLEPQGKGRVLSVEQIRQLNIRLAHASYGGGWKAAVFIHAERMPPGAANAFLKTLEEPPGRCLLLLLTEQASWLLPTIRSRCQQISLHAGAQQPQGDWMPALVELLRLGPPADPVDALTRAASADRLLQAMTKQIADSERNGSGGDDPVDEDVVEARVRARVKEVQEELVKAIQNWQRDVLVLAAGAEGAVLYYSEDEDRLRDLAAAHSWSTALASLQAVDDAARYLDQNMPALVVFETLFVAQGRAAQRRPGPADVSSS